MITRSLQGRKNNQGDPNTNNNIFLSEAELPDSGHLLRSPSFALCSSLWSFLQAKFDFWRTMWKQWKQLKLLKQLNIYSSFEKINPYKNFKKQYAKLIHAKM